MKQPEMKCFRSVKTAKTRLEFRMEDIKCIIMIQKLLPFKFQILTAEMSREKIENSASSPLFHKIFRSTKNTKSKFRKNDEKCKCRVYAI